MKNIIKIFCLILSLQFSFSSYAVDWYRCYRFFTGVGKVSKKTVDTGLHKVGMTEKEAAELKAEHNQMLSRYSKVGYLDNGAIEVRYIGENGNIYEDYVFRFYGEYIGTESGAVIPRNQVLSISKSEISTPLPKEMQANEQLFSRSRKLLIPPGTPSDVADFRASFNNPTSYVRSIFEGQEYKSRDRYISLRYQGQWRFGIINRIERGKGEEGYMVIDFLEESYTNKNGKVLEELKLHFSHPKTLKILKTINLSDQVYTKMRSKYAGSNGISIEHPGIREERQLFRTAFNWSSLTDKVKYVSFVRESGNTMRGYEHNSAKPHQLFEIVRIDDQGGYIVVKSLEAERRKLEQGLLPGDSVYRTISSFYLKDVQVNRAAREYAEKNEIIRLDREMEERDVSSISSWLETE